MYFIITLDAMYNPSAPDRSHNSAQKQIQAIVFMRKLYRGLMIHSHWRCTDSLADGSRYRARVKTWNKIRLKIRLHMFPILLIFTSSQGLLER